MADMPFRPVMPIQLPTQVLLPAAIGLLLAAGLMADIHGLRGLSLRWLAPFFRGEAPPIAMLAVALLLSLGILVLTALRRWIPSREHAPIVLLFVATQLVGFNLANIEPLKIALLIVSGSWLASAMVNNLSVRVYPPFLMMWLAILAFSIASVVNGLVGSLVAQYSIVAKFLMFFIVANIVRTPAQLLFTVRLLVALGIASATLSLVQEALFYFFQLPLSLEDNATKYWFKETPLGWMIRATGFHPTAQNLSHYLLMATAMLVMGPFSRAYRIVGAVLMGLGVFFTFSGNGLVVMAFMLFLTPVIHRPRFVLHYLSALGATALVLYQVGALGWVYEKYLLPISGKSAEDRISLLQIGLDVIHQHPLIGIGLNNFGRLSPQPVHNAYLQMVTEIGVIPGVLLCLMLMFVLIRLLIGVRQTVSADLRGAGKGIVLALIGLAFHFLFEPFINSLVSWAIIGLAEAAALLLYQPHPALPAQRRAPALGLGPALTP